MTYQEALLQALTHPELVKEYDRLTSSTLGACLRAVPSGGLAHQIDVATGRFAEELGKFKLFFDEFVYARIPEIVKAIKQLNDESN